MTDLITIRLPRCVLILTEAELLSLLHDHPEVWEKALRRGKWRRRSTARERRKAHGRQA